jgi:hypothetical protein
MTRYQHYRSGALIGAALLVTVLGACGADDTANTNSTTEPIARVGAALTASPALPKLGSDMVPADPRVAKPRALMLAPAAPVGPRKVAVLMVHFGTPGDVTPAQLIAQAFTNPDSASALISESSFGKVSLTGDVFGWYQIPSPTVCDLGAISESARAAATAAGVNLDAYDHLAYYAFPSLPFCFGGSAWGEVGTPASPARQTWYSGSWGTYIVAHEVGHNLGFLHAHSYECGSTTLATPDKCIWAEYGDVFDPMGASTTQFSTYNKAAQGWLGACDVVTSPARAIFNVVPFESTAAGFHAVRVPMDASLCPPWAPAPCYYYIEYRQPIGVFDSQEFYAPMTQGALLRIGGPIDLSGATALQAIGLLDLTPMHAGDPFPNFQDAALATGKAFQDPVGVHIAVQSANASAAKIAVEIPNGRGNPTCLDNTGANNPSLCTNGVRDGGETDVDCGGPCAPCNVGRPCSVALDCWSRTCVNRVCQPPPPTCDDGIKNQNESDIDCGGANSCARCGDGLTCTVGSDCQSGLCANGLCMDAQLRAVVRVTSDWAAGFCGDITLTNTGTTQVTDWKLKIRFADSSFTQTWNAVYTPGASSIDDVTPVDWNHGIWPKSSMSAGFCANKTGPSYRPLLITVIAQH